MNKLNNRRIILPDGTKLNTYTADIFSLNSLEVEAGTTGYMGGDSGHGGRTYFRIQDTGCTDIEVNSFIDEHDCCGFEVILGGDSELETTIRALKFIANVLEGKIKEANDVC